MATRRTYEEAAEAAELMNVFRTTRAEVPVEETRDAHADACAVFFDKNYLTMSEFLAPIGGMLTRHKPKSESTIGGFLSSAIKAVKPKEKSDREKLQELLGHETQAQAVTLDHLKRIESIRHFLDRIGG